jgi:diguanylate cyclase (GGDEF)-like protein
VKDYLECIPQLNTILSALTPNEYEWVLATREQVVYTTSGVLSSIGISTSTHPESHPWVKEIFSGANRITKKVRGWRGDFNRICNVVGIALLDTKEEVKGALLYITPYNNHFYIETLLTTIQEMIQEENLNTALDIFTRKSLNIFGCAMIGIYLKNEGKYTLSSVSANQKESIDFLEKREFPQDFGVNYFEKEINGDLEFEPILRDISELKEEWVLPFKSFGISHMVCMPLIHYRQLLGVVVLFGNEEDLLTEEQCSDLTQVIPIVSSFVYEQRLRNASFDREQALTLLLRGTEILVQADSEEQLLSEAGEMAMEILFLPGGFFLLANSAGKWEIRSPFGRLKQTDWDWNTWISQYIFQKNEVLINQHKTVYVLEIEDNPFNWERVLIQPLQTHSGIVGELWLMNKKENVADQRQEILSAFVRCVGVALETIRQRDELALLANTDRLTGILNRQGFEQRIREEMAGTLRRESTFLLLVLDLDLFKQINDTHGHPVGDEVLKTIAQNLRSAVREQDIVSRTGGDEFTVVLTDIQSGEEALLVIERMKKSMQLEDYELGVSIGVAEFPTEGRDYDELYRLADLRLYQGKNMGKGKIVLN